MVAALRALVLVVALGAATGACVSRAPLAKQYEGPEDLPASLAERFAYEPQALAQDGDELRERRSFVVRQVSLGGADGESESDAREARDTGGDAARAVPGDAKGDSDIVFEYYDLDGGGPTPVVVLLPILNGNLMVTRYFARYFASRGWAAVVVDRVRDPIEEALVDPEAMIRANITDYRRVLDWVALQPELDNNDIGVFGISFGGMDALMLAALDERVNAVVAAMAGGDLPYLVMNTSYRGVVREVHRYLEKTGMSRDVLERQIDEMLDTDPLDLAPYVDAEEVLLVMTRTDMIIPYETQEELRSVLGRPETLYLPTGHRTSVVYFPLLRSSAYQFFARHFEAR